MDDCFHRMQQRYIAQDLPWDDDLPPPEIQAIAETMPPGRMLDMGCGGGRACIYLAQRGWRCTGVDFVPEAIALAQERAAAAGVAHAIQFYTASVTALDVLSPPYDLVVDVGCMHALRGDDLPRYAAQVARLLREGGLYVLFARLKEAMTDESPRGITEPTIRAVMGACCEIEQCIYGETHTSESSWRSAWFWMRRTSPLA
jgi:SAM-dependent methyltransferase